jgi:hypothetical protein
MVLISYRNGRARVGQGRRTRTVLKLDFELGLASWTDLTLLPGDTAAAPVVLIFMLD